MMKRTDKEKSFTHVSQTDDHSDGENAKSLVEVSLDVRKREALKPLYLDRYE